MRPGARARCPTGRPCTLPPASHSTSTGAAGRIDLRHRTRLPSSVAARGLDESRVWPLSLLIQQAFYQQGRDVTQAALLVELAEAAGLSRERFAERYDDPATKAETSADFSWVENLGIAGFPTLLAAPGQLALLTNGYQPLTAAGSIPGPLAGAQRACLTSSVGRRFAALRCTTARP